MLSAGAMATMAVPRANLYEGLGYAQLITGALVTLIVMVNTAPGPALLLGVTVKIDAAKAVLGVPVCLRVCVC